MRKDDGIGQAPVLDERGTLVGRVGLMPSASADAPSAHGEQVRLAFVSRTDLLRALATDPPLDLWA